MDQELASSSNTWRSTFAPAVMSAGAVYSAMLCDSPSTDGTKIIDVGQTRANLVVAPIGSGGGVKIYNGSTQPVELVADVSGYFSGGAPNAQNQFGVVDPTRVLDTRIGLGAPAIAIGEAAGRGVFDPLVACGYR